jgi:hypothetical protein
MGIAGGCRTGREVREALGMESPYLLYGFDAICLPGQPAEVAVRLQEGMYLTDQEGVLIQLRHGGQLVALARTDPEGYARMTFTPSQVGNYHLTAGVLEGQLDEEPEPSELLVACRKADERFVIVDIDRTLVPSFFAQFSEGQAEPIPGSLRTLGQLDQGRSILYLTLRLDYFGPKTRSWLARHEYPDGPLWVARFHGLLEGNRDFRARRLRHLRRRYPGNHAGIGDKVSSIVAYLANEMTAVLLVRVEQMQDPDACRQTARAMAALPPTYQACRSWDEIRRALVEGESFPPQPVIQALHRRAGQLEQQD